MRKHTVHTEGDNGKWIFRIYEQGSLKTISKEFPSLESSIEHEEEHYRPLGTSNYVGTTPSGKAQVKQMLNPFA